MSRIITHRTLLIDLGFIIAFVAVIVAFLTAKTYTQLAIAIIFYPLVAFFAYKLLQDKIWNRPAKDVVVESQPVVTVVDQVEDVNTENIGIADIDKRLFLKLIGATGFAFFIISIFGRRIESFLFSQSLTTPAPALKTGTAVASSTDGYNISEIDDGTVSFYGFINKDGFWFIMKRDIESGSFRYAKGSTDFPKNWKNRENLRYDYFHNVFAY